MAKRITTGKRDREKLKLQKRQDKLKRREVRQSGGVSSFEDMIAYVDENGRLSSQPQEQPAASVAVEDIQIATPRRLDEEEPPREGRVEYFDTRKGYGFIKDAESGEKCFFHISEAPAEITEGNQVTFEMERGIRGMNAVRVAIVKKH